MGGAELAQDAGLAWLVVEERGVEIEDDDAARLGADASEHALEHGRIVDERVSCGSDHSGEPIITIGGGWLDSDGSRRLRHPRCASGSPSNASSLILFTRRLPADAAMLLPAEAMKGRALPPQEAELVGRRRASAGVPELESTQPMTSPHLEGGDERRQRRRGAAAGHPAARRAAARLPAGGRRRLLGRADRRGRARHPSRLQEGARRAHAARAGVARAGERAGARRRRASIRRASGWSATSSASRRSPARCAITAGASPR